MATTAQDAKVGKVMGEFKRGTLRSSSGNLVTKRSQAIAIGLSEAGLSRKRFAMGGLVSAAGGGITTTSDVSFRTSGHVPRCRRRRRRFALGDTR